MFRERGRGQKAVGGRGGQNAAPQETFLNRGEGVAWPGRGYEVWPLEGAVFFLYILYERVV